MFLDALTRLFSRRGCGDAHSLSRLGKLLGDVIISQGGVVPFIQPELLPTGTKKGRKDGASQEV